MERPKKNNKKILKKKSTKRSKYHPYKFKNKKKSKSFLGGGCFGSIYYMINTIDNQEYAVKHINIKKIQTTLTLFKNRPIPRSQTIEFIFNEAKTLAQLNHPNIVRYFNTKYTRQTIYISFEIAHGGNLEEAIIKKVFNNKANIIYNILIQIVSGLSYLHSKNILHRDIKASNILLLTDKYEIPQIKLGDFGLSCLMNGNQYYQTNNQNGQGDIFYRSPEAVAGKSYGKGDDNWAVGIILLELISGIILSKCISGDIFSIYQNFNDYIEQITDDYCFECTDDSYNSKLAMITKKLLNKEPDERITSEEIINIDNNSLPSISPSKKSNINKCKSTESVLLKIKDNYDGKELAFLPDQLPMLIINNQSQNRPHSV